MDHLKEIILKKLTDIKAKDVATLDVQELTDHFDMIVIATGTSSRHVQSIADHLVEELKKEGLIKNSRVESDDDAQWILIDLGRVIIHVMQQETRDFYHLEKLWSIVTIPTREAKF
jgi:ribosome-associated protein